MQDFFVQTERLFEMGLLSTKAGFGEKITEAIEKSKRTIEFLAETMGISVKTITRWKKGETLPDLYQISKLAELLDKKVQWFFMVEEPTSSPEPTESILELKRDRDAWRAEAEEWKGRCKALEEKKCTVSKQKRHSTY